MRNSIKSIGVVFFLFASLYLSVVIVRAESDDYKSKGCYPSNLYMSSAGLTFTDTEYSEYKLPDGVKDYADIEGSESYGCYSVNYQSLKDGDSVGGIDVNVGKSLIECHTDKTCASSINRYVPQYQCGDTYAQCIFVKSGTFYGVEENKLKIACCPDSSLTHNGQELETPEDTEVPDFTCISVENPDKKYKASAEEVEAFNCTNNQVTLTGCEDITDKIEGKETEKETRYLCSEGVGDGTGYCCDFKYRFEATDSFTGCDNVGADDEEACRNCMLDENGATGAIWTALGCIDPSPAGIITRLYQIGIGIAGGLILLIKVPQIVIGYNSGNPEQIQQVQQDIWMIVGGLVLLIFATVILEMLGVNIISLPGGFI